MVMHLATRSKATDERTKRSGGAHGRERVQSRASNRRAQSGIRACTQLNQRAEKLAPAYIRTVSCCRAPYLNEEKIEGVRGRGRNKREGEKRVEMKNTILLGKKG